MKHKSAAEIEMFQTSNAPMRVGSSSNFLVASLLEQLFAICRQRVTETIYWEQTSRGFLFIINVLGLALPTAMSPPGEIHLVLRAMTTSVSGRHDPCVRKPVVYDPSSRIHPGFSKTTILDLTMNRISDFLSTQKVISPHFKYILYWVKSGADPILC